MKYFCGWSLLKNKEGLFQTSFPLLMQTMNPDDARQIQQLLQVRHSPY
jgi:hypothetical protein